MINYSHDDVRILQSQITYQGFNQISNYQLQHKLFDGTWSTPLNREVLQTRQVAGVLLYDPILEQVVLIEQFRIGALKGSGSPWLLEIVAGVMEPQDVDFEALARREIKEEAGLEPLAILPIAQFWTSPGGSSEFVKLFCAKVDASLAGGLHGLSAEHEDIRVVVMSVEEALVGLATGKICNAITIIALQWLHIKRTELNSIWG